MKEADVFWDPQLAACLMPSGSVKEQDGVTACVTWLPISSRCRFIASALA
jgi:hypothetical protein